VENVVVIGAGYVGLVTGASLAATGQKVTVVEIDKARREALLDGESPIYEPGLDDLLVQVRDSGHFRVIENLEEALRTPALVIVAVGTPPLPDGRADLTALQVVANSVKAHAQPGTVLVIKSTVPPGTTARLARRFASESQGVSVVACPEFLREGSALDDVGTAPRVVIGGDDDIAIERVWNVMNVPGAHLVRCDHTTAELIKYASNSFLAMKISFINEMSALCEVLGGDVDGVAEGMGLDPRIGKAFLNAGLGFGGSCFPKDVRALDAIARRSGYSSWMLKTALEVNEAQRIRFVQKIRAAVGNLEGKRIALLGLAFKPGTDDMRHAPSIDIATRLQELGAHVTAHDPVAMENASSMLPGVEMVDDPYNAVVDADAVAVLTEWPEYLNMDWKRVKELMAASTVVDGRNCLQSETLTDAGLDYWSVGRPPVINLTGIRQMPIYAATAESSETDSDRVDDMVEVR
jgi:UDPglucose 6-dehydrogenase